MLLYNALPPELYEILNCAIAAICYVALVIVVRYLATAYFQFRLALGRWESFNQLRTLKLAVGFLIFLLGEAQRMTWVWLARYLANTQHDVYWMGQFPWYLIPVIGSALSVLGMACIIRALVPEVWGRFSYWVSLGIAVLAVVVTQVVR